jgi:transcriptional regulator with XRE-family HTH domain
MTAIYLRIEELRNAKGWSQAELARRSGVPQPTISRLEARKSNSIDLVNLERLADALGVNAAVLIEHERPRK